MTAAPAIHPTPAPPRLVYDAKGRLQAILVGPPGHEVDLRAYASLAQARTQESATWFDVHLRWHVPMPLGAEAITAGEPHQ